MTRSISTSSGSKNLSLEDTDSLLPLNVIARKIIEDLEAALSGFAAIAKALQQTRTSYNLHGRKGVAWRMR